jgi:hypothetical protein
MKDDPNDKAFEPQIAKQVSWIDKNLEAKQQWLREQEMFYRATDYRGS